MKDIKIKDIHHPGVSQEFDRLTTEDLDRLLDKKDQFVDSGCPACHGMDVESAFEYQRLNYRRCADCELLYISPAPTEEMHLDYVVNSSAMTYWREIANPSMKESRRPMYQERVNYSKKLFESLQYNPESSLEIGGGNGEFAEELASDSEIRNIVVLEPQQLDLKSNKIEILTGGFDDLNHMERTFDVVFAWELIEHILEPDQFLQLVRKVMAPGAMFLLSTPNEKSVETRKLQTESSNILFDHVRLYNPNAIKRLFERNGFRIVELSTPGLLDVERLETHMRENPGVFDDDPALQFLLNSDETLAKNFQGFLQANLLSSHMRLAAVLDGESKGSKTPLINVDPDSKNKVMEKDGRFQPTTFNDVVLPHALDEADPYPPKLMNHIFLDIIKVKSGRIVDLGGGWGQHAKIVADMGYEVTSVDRERATLEVPSILCDFMIDPLPFDDNSIDVIYSKSVIEHFYVRDLPHLFGEVLRVLKPGGVFVITTPDWEYNMREFYHIFTHVTPYTKSSLRQCLQMYGFNRVSTRNLIQLPMVWNNRWLKMLSDLTSILPLPRSMNKWVRWSKERLLLGLCYKPVA